MKKSVKIFGLFVILILVMINFISSLSTYCVTAEVSDISPSSIGINEEFTVGVQIENCGANTPQSISFELIDPPKNIEIKEPLIININNLNYANSERIIVYHMKTNDAQPGKNVIKTKLSYAGEDASLVKYGNITIDVIGDEAELNIASAKTDPVIPRQGDEVELTLRIENFGEGDANSIKVEAEHPFEGVKEAFIGTLENGEDGPAVFTFIVNKAGEFEFPVNISYKDDFGEHQIEFGLKLIVLRQSTNWFLILLVIVVIVFAIWGFLNYAKLKRSKNKIIHQLLNRDGKEEVESMKMETDGEKKKRERKKIRQISKNKKR